MKLPSRPRLPAAVSALVDGRPLAFASYAHPGGEGWLVATRTHLVEVEEQARSWPWHEIYSADWDQERLRVRPLAPFGRARGDLTYAVVEPGLLLQVIRERVQASLVIQRHVSAQGPRGFRVIARRDLSDRAGAMHWYVDLDPGIDPTDPAVQELADRALEAARGEVEI